MHGTVHVKATLPNDIDALKAMLIERDLIIESLKLQIAKMKRARFGASSEQLTAQLAFDTQIEQLELIVEDLESSQASVSVGAISTAPESLLPRQPNPPALPTPPTRKALPAHLLRERVVHDEHSTPCQCKACGETLARMGEDQSEVLEYVPGRFKVIVHVRPKYVCRSCNAISQAPAPVRPIDRSPAGAGLLAHVLTAKYADHLPLYRQSVIYARDGVELTRSTLADWVGGASRLLNPLVAALNRYVLDATKLHADDTPVPVLQPGRGTTKTGRLWTYVRDDRAAGSDEAPAVWFAYSPDRKGEHPQLHLQSFKGVLQADGYAGFDRLYATGTIAEAACWAHVRRKFFDLHALQGSTVALEALNRIGALYGVETDIRGKPPDERWRTRQARSKPLMSELKLWFEQTLARLSKKSELAVAIRYALTRWVALTRYLDDGVIEIDNNAAERALRCVALGRKNFLFAGSDAGGERAASIYSLIGSAKLNALDPEAYLRYVIERIATHPIRRVHELLPWQVAASIRALQPHAIAA